MTTDHPQDQPPQDAADAPQGDEQPAAGSTGPERGNDARTAADAQGHDDSHDDTEHDDDGPNAEAKRYRLRLRETEAERDQLAHRLEALQRQAVEAHAVAAGIRPAALWASGAQIADLLDDDGTIDADRVRDACETATTELGLLTKPGPYVPREGTNHGRPAQSPQQRMIDVVMGNDT